jgi:hypothetical protein
MIGEGCQKNRLKSIMLALYGKREGGEDREIKKFVEGRKYLYIFLKP